MLFGPTTPAVQRPTLVTGEDPLEYVSQPEKFVTELNELSEACRRMRYDEEREWLRAWAFYKGRHWVTWREDKLVEIEQQRLPKIVVNYVMNVVQTRLGHLTKNRPMWVGIPATADEDSRNATRLGLKVLEAYHHRLRMQKKLLKWILHGIVSGTSFLKIGWDPLAGGKFSIPLSDGTPETGPLGDTFIDVVKAWELLVEPGADDIDSAQRVVHESFQPIGQVLRRWPQLKGKIEPIDPNTHENRALLEAQFGSSSGAHAANRVLVSEAWFRSGTPRPEGEQYEQGLCATVINGKEVVSADPIEEGMPEIPFVRFAEVETDGFYGQSTARQLVDLNKILDIEFSHQEFNRRVMRPKTLMPFQAQVDKEAWDQNDDEVVEYFAPYEPKPYSPPGIPAHHVELRNAMVGMVKEIGGNFDVLSGSAGSDVRSGRMVSYLQEYAGTVLGVVAQNIESSYEELGTMLLQVVQTKVTEERYIPLVGANRRMEVLAFKGADLRGMAGVWVQAGSAQPISRAERQDRIERYMENKWLDPKKGMRMLSIADPDSDLYADDEQDKEIADDAVFKLKAANPETLKAAIATGQQAADSRAARMMPMAQGAPPPAPFSERDVLRAMKIEAFEFEDHQSIVDQVNRAYRKTRAYRDAPAGIRALADAYCDWHVMLAQGIDPDRPGSMLLTGHVPKPGPNGPGGPPTPPPGGPGGTPPGADPGTETAEGLPPVPSVPGPDKSSVGEAAAAT